MIQLVWRQLWSLLIHTSWFLTPPLRPAAIGGAGPPLPHLQGDAVGADAGRQPGPDPPAEGDPRRQGGDHHHRRQRLHLLPHPQEGQDAWCAHCIHYETKKTQTVLHRFSILAEASLWRSHTETGIMVKIKRPWEEETLLSAPLLSDTSLFPEPFVCFLPRWCLQSRTGPSGWLGFLPKLAARVDRRYSPKLNLPALGRL